MTDMTDDGDRPSRREVSVASKRSRESQEVGDLFLRLQTVAERYGIEDYDPLVQALDVIEDLRLGVSQSGMVLTLEERNLYIQTQLRIAEYVRPKVKAKDPSIDDSRIDEVKLELASRIMALLETKP